MRKILCLLIITALLPLYSCSKDDETIGGGKNGNFDETTWEGYLISNDGNFVFKHVYVFQKGTVTRTYTAGQYKYDSETNTSLYEASTGILSTFNYTYEYIPPYLNLASQGIIYMIFTYKDGKLIDQEGNIYTQKK